ncbi:MAG: TraB/GumN family protein [Oscillospiraceae bacterium]
MKQHCIKRLFAVLLCGALLASCGLKTDSSASGKPAGTTTSTGATDSLTSSQTDSVAGDESYTDTIVFDGEKTADHIAVTPAMWKVADKTTGGVLYLLGSMHAVDMDIYPLPKEIKAAYDASDALAVECDVTVGNDMASQFAMLKKMECEDGKTIADYLGDTLYGDCVKALKADGLYLSMYDQYQPVFWESLFEQAMITDAGMDAVNGIDMLLIKQAKADGKALIELESRVFQENLLINAPLEYYTANLRYYTAAAADAKKSLQTMFDVWAKGDIDAIAALSETEVTGITFSDAEKSACDAMNKALLNDRNPGMIDKAADMLKKGQKVFYVVGAAHYAGDIGIIVGLQNAGYTVERVDYATQTASDDTSDDAAA